MREDNIISLEVAKLARAKGFNEVCDYAWCFDTTKEGYYLGIDMDYYHNDMLWEKHFTAPSREQLNKWLRDRNIFITIEVDQTMEPKFCYSISKHNPSNYDWENFDPSGTALFYTHEKALDEALEEALKLLA